MKKIILLLLSVFLAHGAMADDSTGELTQPIIKTAHGDFNAYGRPVAYLRANLQTLDFQSIQDAANHGDAHAQFVMAKFYEMGVHVSKDPTQAQKWYEKSAQLGNSDAQNNLAVYYFEANNPTKAREYLNYAVNQNHLMAMVNMAQDLLRKDGKGDQQAGIELLKKASASGYVPADYVLAVYVYENTDEELFMKHLHKAADAGFAPAQWEMASHYQMGVLSPVSPEQRMQYAKKAVLWASRACDSGHELGCNLKDYYDWNAKKQAQYQETQTICDTGNKADERTVAACQEAKAIMEWKRQWESTP